MIPDDFKTEDDLHAYCMQLVKEDKPEEAIKFLQSFRSRYPLSQRTPDVELLIGDLYNQREQYVEALDMFQQFIELHPTHPRLHYAYMQSAKAHMAQAPSSIDRDQTHVKQALERLETVKRNPDFSQEANASIDKLNAKLAEHDRYVAHYYLKRKQWLAAENRLLAITASTATAYKEEALYNLVRVYSATDRQSEAKERLQQLQQLNSSSPWLQKANQLIK